MLRLLVVLVVCLVQLGLAFKATFPFIVPSSALQAKQHFLYRNPPSPVLPYQPGVIQTPFVQVPSPLGVQSPVSFLSPASTTHLGVQPPRRRAGVQSVLQSRAQGDQSLLFARADEAHTRALCDICSCESDYGCAYNCHKCKAKCLDCDCSTSIGCKYNCDKCEDTSSSSGNANEGSSNSDSSGASTGGASSSGETSANDNGASDASAGLDASSSSVDCNAIKESQLELCMWGPSCQTVLSAIFPSCNYDCNTCTLKTSTCKASSGPAAGQACKFPFIYKGKRYDGCAPVHSATEGLKFWCSTRTDVNGFHVRGPFPNVGKYVGYCDASCPRAPVLPFFW